MKSKLTLGDIDRMDIGKVIIGVLAHSPTSLHHGHLKDIRTLRQLTLSLPTNEGNRHIESTSTRGYS
jgi:hypothetical protein